MIKTKLITVFAKQTNATVEPIKVCIDVPVKATEQEIETAAYQALWDFGMFEWWWKTGDYE